MRNDVIFTLQIQIRVTEDHHPRPITMVFLGHVIDASKDDVTHFGPFRAGRLYSTSVPFILIIHGKEVDR